MMDFFEYDQDEVPWNQPLNTYELDKRGGNGWGLAVVVPTGERQEKLRYIFKRKVSND